LLDWCCGFGIFVVVGVIKLALEAGKATPAPPVGPALGSKGVNIMAFCKDYNARTADKAGYIIPVEITVFDVSFVLSLLQILSFCLIKLKKSNICGGNWLSKMCFAMFMCIWY